MRKKRNQNTNIFIVMILSVFITSFYIREPLLKNLASINIIFIFTLIYYLFKNRKRINSILIITIIFIIMYIIVINIIVNNESIITMTNNIFITIVPMFMLTVRLKADEFEDIFVNTLKLFNFFIVVIFFIGIIDPLINFNIMKFFGNNLTPTLKGWIDTNTQIIGYRYTSFMGHSLFTKELFLMFYILNNIYSKKFNKRLIGSNTVAVLSLIGILLTGSKSGIVLILICIIFTADSKGQILNRIKNSIYTFIIFAITYFMGIFDNVIVRFKSETLTTGRYEYWQQVKQMDIINYKLLSGYGENSYNIVASLIGRHYATAALEYPIRILILKYGILCSTIIVIFLFVRPAIYFVRKREFYILFVFLIKCIDSNTYNGLIYKADNMILFVIFTALLIGASSVKVREYEKNCDSYTDI
ncbi:hypothetical protein [Clostridium gasigenes]|uniref:hypothetical protein n=1 Tax=Clostridium gasigenes TaxID=94869 RepID=UPI001C0D6A00|nr:hypothetical protein [Clostridium gasigenes]MBU3107656.1 hypothetical protein [Clostridium gasigenes]